MPPRRRAVQTPPAVAAPLERTVVFYRVFVDERNGQIGRFDTSEICKDLRAAQPRLYGIGNDRSLVPDIAPRATDRFALLRVTWRGLPDRYSQDGVRERLQLPEGYGLSVPTHFRFFRDNVVAVEVNREGPAPTALLDYIYARGRDDFFRLRMRRIPDAETIAKIRRIRTMTSVRIRLSERNLTHLRSDNTYLAPLKRSASLVEDGGVFEVSWSVFRGHGLLNAEALKALTMSIIEQDEALESSAQIELVGQDRNGAPVEYTLARDYVTSRQSIVRDASGNIAANDAYDALENAYNEARPRFSAVRFLPER